MDRRAAVFSDGDTLAFDLFLGVPRHVAPKVVLTSGLAVDGWIPVNPATLETAFDDVYAVGDVTSVGTPKAGVFAEGQAAVVAASILARVRGDAATTAYDGRGTCYLEFGDGEVARVTVSFLAGSAARRGARGAIAQRSHVTRSTSGRAACDGGSTVTGRRGIESTQGPRLKRQRLGASRRRPSAGARRVATCAAGWASLEPHDRLEP